MKNIIALYLLLLTPFFLIAQKDESVFLLLITEIVSDNDLEQTLFLNRQEDVLIVAYNETVINAIDSLPYNSDKNWKTWIDLSIDDKEIWLRKIEVLFLNNIEYFLNFDSITQTENKIYATFHTLPIHPDKVKESRNIYIECSVKVKKLNGQWFLSKKKIRKLAPK